jgi:para-aminobenzoate synthetase component 1
VTFYSTALPYAANAGGYFSTIADLPWAAWLDSGGRGRYDILVAQPIATLVTRADKTKVAEAGGEQTYSDDPFSLLREKLGNKNVNNLNVPFSGGVLGYWGYDLARRWMTLPEQDGSAQGLPDMAVGIYDWALVIDHHRQEAKLVSQLRNPETAKKLPEILERLRIKSKKIRDHFCVTGEVTSNFSRAEYGSAFSRIHDYLIAGDCYQVNLAQRFTALASGCAFDAYMRLREISPAPYAAYLNFPQGQILCASPERFLQVRGGKVETKPIKGTRRRATDGKLDALLIKDLQGNAKDRAENLMIVDLLRNDLSKNCVTGSVKVEKMFEVESYANVHHLVSTITGRLIPESDALSLLKDCFPGGSITGAPKQRAMEIIAELEPQRRGIYCGSIGYIGWDGNMDTNIAIRTLIYEKGEIHGSAGGGIIADSVMEAEYEETQHKASGMLQMMSEFSKQK